MQIILTKEEYDDLVRKATALELQVEEKVDEAKKHFTEHMRLRLQECLKRHHSFDSLIREIREVLNHY